MADSPDSTTLPTKKRHMLDEKIYGTLSDQELAMIERCNIAELVVIFDTCIIVCQGILGVTNQPRCTEECSSAMDTLFTNRIELVKHEVIEAAPGFQKQKAN